MNRKRSVNAMGMHQEHFAAGPEKFLEKMMLEWRLKTQKEASLPSLSSRTLPSSRASLSMALCSGLASDMPEIRHTDLFVTVLGC